MKHIVKLTAACFWCHYPSDSYGGQGTAHRVVGFRCSI